MLTALMRRWSYSMATVRGQTVCAGMYTASHNIVVWPLLGGAALTATGHCNAAAQKLIRKVWW
jgi:hypothetical protein